MGCSIATSPPGDSTRPFEIPTARPGGVYRRIVERFGELDADEARRLERLVADEFRRQGITFTVYSEEEGHRADMAHRSLPPAHLGARVG